MMIAFQKILVPQLDLAFALAGTIDVVNGFNALFPLLPKIPMVHIVDLQTLFPERPWKDMGGAWVSRAMQALLTHLFPNDIIAL